MGKQCHNVAVDLVESINTELSSLTQRPCVSVITYISTCIDVYMSIHTHIYTDMQYSCRHTHKGEYLRTFIGFCAKQSQIMKSIHWQAKSFNFKMLPFELQGTPSKNCRKVVPYPHRHYDCFRHNIISVML